MNQSDKKAQAASIVIFLIISPIIFVIISLLYNALNIEPTVTLTVLQVILSAAFGLLTASIAVVLIRKTGRTK